MFILSLVFSIQDSILSRFPIFCANAHLPGYGMFLGKDTKSFEWLHSLPHKRKTRTTWHQFVIVKSPVILSSPARALVILS